LTDTEYLERNHSSVGTARSRMAKCQMTTEKG